MQLLLTRHLWGITEPWEQVFPRIHADGYGAIEAPVPAPADHARFRALLDQYGFAYIAMIFTSGRTVADHLDSFREQIAASRSLQPIMINSHSGQDAWDEGQSRDFFAQALALEATLDILVAHETHRGRILYNPWITQRLLQQFEQLHLCCDLSHWVCVCERLLDAELDIIQQCAQRCIHLHARVGYEQGPQVPDPRAPEYQRHVEAHERWWQLIWDAQAVQGQTVSTLTPEFGPPDYLHTLPYSHMPVANLWEICNWQAQRQFDIVRKDAIDQVAAGAAALDINAGVPGADEPALIQQIICNVIEVVDVPLCIDTASPLALAAALSIYEGRALINSVNGEERSLNAVLPLVKEYGAAIIGLCMDDNGIPGTAEQRFAVAARIIEHATQLGIALEDVIIDPLAMAMSADSKAGRVALDTIQMVVKEFGVNISMGASNMSFGLPDRKYINATYIAMAIHAGLTCPITNPLLIEVNTAVLAADLSLGRDDYSMRWIKAYRKREKAKVAA